jgi:hypothetical protein
MANQTNLQPEYFNFLNTFSSRCRCKFAVGVVDTGGAHSLANISANVRKKFEMTLMLLSEAGGKMIHEKNQKQKLS